MDTRAWYDDASRGVVALAERIGSDQWAAPGLGDWEVRSLAGHTTRAWLTVEQYLGAESSGPTLSGPAAYYAATRTGLGDPVAVTQRGRDAGVALGEDPAAEVRAIARRVTGLVADAPDDAAVATPVGAMTLLDYLPTRAFELTVHGIDLARAIGADIPQDLLGCLASAIGLAGDVASPEQRVSLLLAATGREPLPSPFTVL